MSDISKKEIHDIIKKEIREVWCVDGIDFASSLAAKNYLRFSRASMKLHNDIYLGHETDVDDIIHWVYDNLDVLGLRWADE